MQLALIVTLAFVAGVLSASLVALACTRHHRDKVHRELEFHRERVRTLEHLLLYHGGPSGAHIMPPVITVPPAGHGW
ncbi:hypothetical protein ACWEGE_23820 [Amycolatopsis sp. NPDC004747]